MNLDKKIFFTLENVDLNKHNLFAISKKNKTKIIAINNLKLELKGEPLTQIHKDIIEAIILSARIKKFTKKGFDVAFSIADVLETLGHKHKGNYKWLEKKLEELFFSGFKIEIVENNQKYVIYFHVIEKFGYLQDGSIINPKTGKGFIKEKTYFAVRFSPEFTKLAISGILIKLDRKQRERLIKTRSPFIKAFIRYCISFKELNMELTSVLFNINALNKNSSPQIKKNLFQKIKQHTELLEYFGIKIKKCKKDKRKYCVFYKSKNFLHYENYILSHLKEFGLEDKEALNKYIKTTKERLKCI